MKCSVSGKASSLLCIAALTLELFGCTSTKEVTNDNNAGGQGRAVSTRGGTVYHLEQWTLLANGDISGKGYTIEHKQIQQVGGDQLVNRRTPFEGVILADSMATLIQPTHDSDATRTIVTVGVVVGTVALLVYAAEGLRRWGSFTSSAMSLGQK